jgi:phosphonoacetaldehyde hydrolase
MTSLPRRFLYTGPVIGVVLDWAGTTVDYGCRGPAAVFVQTFMEFGVCVSPAEARQFMGLAKKDHIRAMCGLSSVKAKWLEVHGRSPEDADIDALYALTEPMMVSAVSAHADLIPGVLESVAGLRARNIRIGSSTGYTRPMLDVLAPAAEKNGYKPDVVICSSDVPAGRPYPWMCYANAIRLQVYPLEAMVKIGDTVSDIQEGLNAGMWTIGITRTGNEMGLSQKDVSLLPELELKSRLAAITSRFLAAGAHYTVESIAGILPVIDKITRLLSRGEHPLRNRFPASPLHPDT